MRRAVRLSAGAGLLLASAVLAFDLGVAQPSSTLEAVLQRLELDLENYSATVPSFFCDEHAVSKMIPGHRDQNATTDSTFRLKRVRGTDGKTLLLESREIRMQDGHPAQGDTLAGPAILNGAFSDGPSIVSLSQMGCMSYVLEAPQNGKPYVIDFSTKASSNRPALCVLQEDAAGKAFVDRESMHVSRIEFVAPHHTIFPGGKAPNGYIVPPVTGVWKVSIAYAPVSLEAKTFWMPSMIEATETSSDHSTVWSFEAQYDNFHKLEVTSRILP